MKNSNFIKKKEFNENIFEIYEKIFPEIENDFWFDFLKKYTKDGYIPAYANNIAFLLDEIDNSNVAKLLIIKLIKAEFNPFVDIIDDQFILSYPEIEIYYNNLKKKENLFVYIKKETLISGALTGIKFNEIPSINLDKYCFRLGYDFVTYMNKDKKIFVSYNPFSNQQTVKDIIETVKKITNNKTYLYISK